MPNGVAYHDGALYVAEVSRILRFDDMVALTTRLRLSSSSTAGAMVAEIPAYRPGRLSYAPVSVPCNVCETGDASWHDHRLALDGSTPSRRPGQELRRRLGSQTQELWFITTRRPRRRPAPDEGSTTPWEAASAHCISASYCHAAHPRPGTWRSARL